MNNTELNTFLLVAQCGSFSKAAKQLYISKNAVMQQINNLEANLDLTLFIRTTHGVKLTNAGRALINKAKQLQQLTKEINLSLSKYKNTIVGGSGFLNFPITMNKNWPRFSNTHKDKSLSFIEIQDYENIPQEIDIFEGVYSERPFSRQGFKFKKYCSVPLVAILSINDPLKTAAELTFKDFENRTISIPSNATLKSTKLTADVLNEHVQNFQLKEYSILNTAVINNAHINQNVLIIPKSMSYLADSNLVKPIAWDLSQDYGFYYRPDANESSINFMNFILSTQKKLKP
ncbi:LysR family transcriptional regulator [uncultured Lactobacillus sp.]|uniref:LysR family transcriptional regulator n=1 Tax=uncultured Lactobacillus sp. TaxID=153152 RepID=UPI00261ABD79|nr:LysR family transcriptional regulator [uncultured Lactobacillus sp.]